MPRVLIAEDNSANVLLIRDFCKDMDFEPMVVEDGRAVVEAVRSSPPDVILMDIDAPIVDGLTATIEIRGLHNVGEQMMIIGLNSGSPAMAAACRIAGMNQILTKPLQPERLMAALRAARAPLNLQAAVSEEHQEETEIDELLARRVADIFGSIPAGTPCARLHYINAPKLAVQFGEDWPDVSSTIETVTRALIEQNIGDKAVYKKAGELDFILIAPGLSRESCAAKCQAIAKEICRALADDEAGAKFHIRTVLFDANPVEAGEAPPDAATLAAQARRKNPDILPWTRLIFWPAWDVQKRKFPIHSVRVDRDETGAVLPEAEAAMREGELNKYYEALDLSAIADLVERLDGYDTLEQPKLLLLPLHLCTLEALTVMTRYLRYMEKIPKKIRERLIIELHAVPPDMRAVQIAELQKPILPHCLHTMLVVPSSYNKFDVLKQISGQLVALKLPETVPDAMPDIAPLKLFSQRAKQTGLPLAVSMVNNRLLRDWGLTSCRYVVGPAVALPQMALGPHAKFIA